MLSGLLVCSAVMLICYGFPEQKKEAKEDLERPTSDELSMFKRLVFVDPCSILGEKCHPLQHCCSGFKCKYDSYFPPKGRCRVKL